MQEPKYPESDVTENLVEAGPASELAPITSAGLRVALQSRDLRLLWLGLVMSATGDSFLLVAMLTYLGSLTDSPLALAAFAASLGLPTLLFGLSAGVFVDRFDRRLMMLASDLVRAGAVLGLLFVNSIRDLPIAMLVAFIMGTAGVLFIPARNALLPRLVPASGLVAANMLVESSQIISLVVGPALGGLFVARFGAHAAVLANSAGYCISAFAIFLLSVRHVKVDAEPLTTRQLRDEMVSGLRYVREHSLLLRLIAAGGASMLGLGAVIILGVSHVETVFGVDPTDFGALLSILGLGMVVGGALAATPYAHRYPSIFVIGGMLTLAASLAVFPFLDYLSMVRLAVFVIGLGLIASRSVIAALIQLNVADDRRGRVESANNVTMAAAYNVSFVATGLFGAVVGTQAAFVGAAAIIAVAGLLAFLAIRRRSAIAALVGADPSAVVPVSRQAAESGGGSGATDGRGSGR